MYFLPIVSKLSCFQLHLSTDPESVSPVEVLIPTSNRVLFRRESNFYYIQLSTLNNRPMICVKCAMETQVCAIYGIGYSQKSQCIQKIYTFQHIQREKTRV